MRRCVPRPIWFVTSGAGEPPLVVEERIADPWGERTPYPRDGDWPVRVDEHVDGAVERWVQSACVLCSHGCALDIGVREGRIVGVRGRGVDRVNHGRLGPKGLYGWQANNAADRLLRPLVRRDGELREASWDEAMDLVVEPHAGAARDEGRAARSASIRAGSSSSRTTTRSRSSLGAGSGRTTSTATRGSARRRRGSR